MGVNIEEILNKKIDLHMHTTMSDGTERPDEIVKTVADNGIGVFSVTDHDTIEGCRMIRTDDLSKGLVFINGVEFSTRDEKGKYHILGYGYDLNAEPVNILVKEAHNIRMTKLYGRLDFLEECFGFEFSDEEKKKLESLSNPGKPHIGKLMVEKGYASNVEDAIKNYINKRKLAERYVRPEEAIDAILKSGGVPVLAHPIYGDGSQLILGEEMDERIRYLMDYGLEGLEAFYSEFTPKMQKDVIDFAEKYGLYMTAGSDYHGKNKLVQIGDNDLEKIEDAPKALAEFLERVL